MFELSANNTCPRSLHRCRRSKRIPFYTQYIAEILKNGQFSNAAASRLTTNLKADVATKVFLNLFPDEDNQSQEAEEGESDELLSTSSDDETSGDEEGSDDSNMAS